MSYLSSIYEMEKEKSYMVAKSQNNLIAQNLWNDPSPTELRV